MNGGAAGRAASTRATALIPAAIGLLLATLLVHGGALSSGWKFDDPGLLDYALRHTPWQTFTSRDAMQALSYAYLTPWNAFFFQLGLPWFGLDPAGHYGHMLLVLWAVSLATWWLLAGWLSRTAAWIGALLFLASAPTAAVSLSLMTGHYAYGLLLAILALLAFVTAIQRNSGWLALLAALAYGLSCLCKESYVPLVALWPILPVGHWRQRLRLALPSMGVGIGYAALRLSVLGGVGGYAWMSADAGVTLRPWPLALQDMARELPSLLLGPGVPGLAAAALALVTIALGARARATAPAPAGAATPARQAGVALAATLLVLVPVAPLFLNAPAHGRERVMFLAAWCLAVGLAWRSDRRQAARWAAVVLLMVLLLSQRAVMQRYDRPSDWEHAQYELMRSTREVQDLVPHEFRGLGYLDAMAQAITLREQRRPAQIVPDEERLVALGPERGRRAWAWHPPCRCMQPLGANYDDRVQRFLAATEAGKPHRAALTLTLTDRGLRKLVQWQIDGPPGAVRFDILEVDRLDVPPQGRLAFGRDVSVRADVLHLRVTIETADGAWVRSPLLSLPLSPSGSVRWATAP